jgi:hypothetical protein
MKKARVKGKWLREIVAEESPALISKNGRRPPLAQEAVFIKWANEQRKREEALSNIRQIIAKWKPHMGAYLAREGFKPGRSGDSALRRGNGKDMLFLSESHGVHPIAYATWQALARIAEIESALAAGDIVHACGHSFILGRLMQESEAHYAVERVAKKNRTGKHTRLFEYALAVWREGMTALELLSTLHSQGKVEWMPSQKIRWKDRHEKWKTTKENTFINSQLPGWKKQFRALRILM